VFSVFLKLVVECQEEVIVRQSETHTLVWNMCEKVRNTPGDTATFNEVVDDDASLNRRDGSPRDK